jgi:hypothetical protein
MSSGIIFCLTSQPLVISAAATAARTSFPADAISARDGSTTSNLTSFFT